MSLQAVRSGSAPDEDAGLSSNRPAQASAAAAPAEKRRLPPAAELPTQIGPNGLRFDFNDGCRVMLPETGRRWHVRLSDLDTGNLLFETDLRSGFVNSTKRYFVRFRLEVWSDDERLLCHDYRAADHDVLIQFPIGTIGDIIGWISYAVKFREQHACRLTLALGAALIPLFRDAYPDIAFVTHEEVRPERFYATYNVALFFNDHAFVHQPCDFRQVGLHRTAGHILGVDLTEKPPRIALADNSRPVAEPYVCIGVQSTTQSKYWNNPDGWRDVVDYLKQIGYRVICIDQKPLHGRGQVWNHMPPGVENETGDRPLQERARWLKHAAAFIGLSSGLSWLAWAAGTPTVLISGFTHPINEFTTPYRIINYHACNSCWNDVRVRFDHEDFLWCPRHKDTPRQFECTRLVTSDHVKAMLRRIPGFGTGCAPAIAETIHEASRETPPHAAGTALANGGMAVGVTVSAGECMDRARVQIAQGDRHAQHGDLVNALENYREGAAIVRRLSDADTGNAAFQRDLSVARNRIGAVLHAQGDLKGAIDEYRASFAVMARLAAAAPDNVEFQRDLAWCKARLAELLETHDRVADALANHDAGFAITNRPTTR
ncbi:MAG TPA: autotransporter strand-loop-strand O-heptosyltransferase [Bradyrhizobium sp.]|nr:autotransporter strand-loop-strand O-heptosyltransferase [Bradyrhizobium sp.]